MKPKKKYCQNCKHSVIVRDGKMPFCICKKSHERGWDAVREFGETCDKHEPKKEGKKA
jgi:hypothetical protein